MKKIFVIEDDPSLAREFQKTLRSEGFSVSLISDAEAGIASAADVKPDLLVIDLQLPGLKVKEWIQALKADAKSKNIPILALGNSFDRKSVDDAWKAGISGCIYKSTLTPRSFIAAVTHAIGPLKSLTERPKAIPMAAASPAPEIKSAAPLTEALAIHAELRETFLEGMTATLAQLRNLLSALVKADEATRVEKISDLHKQVRFLASNAALSEVRNVANLASALEAFLKELHDKPKDINASAIRTLAMTLDFLGTLSQNREAAALDWSVSANVLSVDDEPLSRRAVAQSLIRANLKCVSLESPKLALTLLEENDFDLIILDIVMPELNGLDLCKQIRTLRRHKETPVIFVTSLGDFENRAKSTLAGGSDLIAKPFALMELAVKALIYVLKGQLKNEGEKAKAA